MVAGVNVPKLLLFISRGIAPWFALALLCGCSPTPREANTLVGRTMGTTYSIRIADDLLAPAERQALQAAIDEALEEINRQMSTYRADSEISAFNRAEAEAPVEVSADFLRVLRLALDLAEATGGAFDPTVGALVNLWGFGPDPAQRTRPAPEQIEAARRTVGYRHLAILPDGRLAKSIPELRLDLGAIAKGFGVDQVAQLLRERGIQNFLVEIGGETLAQGRNAAGEPWRIGILRPDFDPAPAALYGVATLTDGQAIATSGDYRNYFRDENGTVQTHVVDPRTARPVRHSVASVSVLADTCALADGLATALLVLGPDEGMPFLRRHFPAAQALFLVRQTDPALAAIATPGFPVAE
jgi:FAD:protein FMN transferase